MRYLPLTAPDKAEMLRTIGVPSIDALFKDVPAEHLNPTIDLPAHATELEVERSLGALAARNLTADQVPSFLGAGIYRHHVPASVDHLIQRGEFLTSYTPYQPEVAQGTLQALFEFQSQVAALTGMEVANASMYDGSTSSAEAVLMALRITKRKKVVLDGHLHPHYSAAIRTLLAPMGGIVVDGLVDPAAPADPSALIDSDTACVVIQGPDVFGHLRDLRPIAAAAKAAGALTIAVVTEIVALGLLESPGAMGADIVAAEGQSLGNAMNLGGPSLGLFATKQEFLRQMPGRLCGQTVDADGTRGFVLTLSTREQHIRREKATSNICTNAGLCALGFSIHVSLLGQLGLQHLAEVNHAQASRLADRLATVPGVTVLNRTFFNEFAVRLNRPAAPVVERLAAEKRCLAGVPASRLFHGHPGDHALDDVLLIAATELTTDEDIDALANALASH